MPRNERQGWSRRTAIVAAVMLFVQTLFGSMAFGMAAAAPMTMDAFGNPLCITSMDIADQDAPAGHTVLPDCCAPGCLTALPLADGDREASALSNPLATQVEPADLASTNGPPAPAEHDPGRPRAPPFLV